MVMSTAQFDIEPNNELDLSGKDSLRIKNYDGTADLVMVTSRIIWVYHGYAWNGADWSSDKHFLDGSMVHDPLCQLMNTGKMDPANHKRVTAIMAAENAKHGMSRFAQFKKRYAVNAHWTHKVKSMQWPAT